MTTLASPVVFQADWPTPPLSPSSAKKVSRVAFNIFSVVIFPVGLTRLSLKVITYLAVKHFIQPATSSYHCSKKTFESLNEEFKTPFTQTFFETPDGERLEGCFFQGNDPNKVILYKGGNCAGYEDASNEIDFLLKFSGASVFSYNSRGVKKNKTLPTKESFAIDSYSAFEALVNLGFDPEKILLFGHSLGGAELALGGALIQKKYSDKNISMISRSSFSSTKDFTRSMLPHGKFLGDLILKLINWNIDPKTAFESLKGKKCIIYSKEDTIIKENASLYRFFEEDDTIEKIELKLGVRLTPEDKKEWSARRIGYKVHNFPIEQWLSEEQNQLENFIKLTLNIDSSAFSDSDEGSS